MLDCIACRNTQVLFQLTEILLDHQFLSDVTGCRKTQVSDCTSSTVTTNNFARCMLTVALCMLQYIINYCEDTHQAIFHLYPRHLLSKVESLVGEHHRI